MDRDRSRDRLKEVHATDLTESRVNEDFVDWLKNKGPTYLLIVLLGITGYLAYIRWSQHKVQRQDEAWSAYIDAPLPSSKEDVALQHPKIFAVPQLALETGATQYLQTVQTGKPLDVVAAADPTAVDPTLQTATLSEEDREHNLTRADDMYRRVLEGDSRIPGDDGSLGWTLHALQALFGRAAVAESRGDVEQARKFYEQAEARAGDYYPTLAELARKRLASVEQYRQPTALPKAADAPTPPAAQAFTPAVLDPALRDLLLDEER